MGGDRFLAEAGIVRNRTIFNDSDKAAVRAFARVRIATPPAGLAEIADNWRTAAPAPPVDEARMPR